MVVLSNFIHLRSVLIAAVTVNCLVTAINGKTAIDTFAVPYIDMLLPPLEDASDNISSNSNEATTGINEGAKATSVSTTTSATTTTRTTTKSIINDVNNILPEPSIEALLPPFFKAKIEQNKIAETTSKISTTTPTTTTTTTTTREPTTSTTIKPSITKTTLKPEVNDLFLDFLLPPSLDNEIVKKYEKFNTTQKPLLDKGLFKTTKKSYYQQQTQQLKDIHLIGQEKVDIKISEKPQQYFKNLQADTKKDLKTLNIPKSSFKKNDKHVSETKQVIFAASEQKEQVNSNIEKSEVKHVALPRRILDNNSKYDNKQYNYNLNYYLGLTTPRPIKKGLPTITPFPHRLGR